MIKHTLSIIVVVVLLATALQAQNATTSGPNYLVRRVFMNSGGGGNGTVPGGTTGSFSFSDSCETVSPNLLNLGSGASSGGTGGGGGGPTADFIVRALRRLRGYTEIAQQTPTTATCSGSPISVWASVRLGTGDSTCTAAQCASLDTSSTTMGGFPLSSNGTSQTGSPQLVSITTYIANQSFVASSAGIRGQQASAGSGTTSTIPLGWNQTPGSIDYCPGTQLITSVFAFQAGHCIVSPMRGGSGGGGGQTPTPTPAPNAQQTSLPSNLPFTTQNLQSSWDIYNKYQAFYASCENGGIVILGCGDTACQNCWLISDTHGCVGYWGASSGGSTGGNNLYYYLNFQGCGLGRASGGGTPPPAPPTPAPA